MFQNRMKRGRPGSAGAEQGRRRGSGVAAIRSALPKETPARPVRCTDGGHALQPHAIESTRAPRPLRRLAPGGRDSERRGSWPRQRGAMSHDPEVMVGMTCDGRALGGWDLRHLADPWIGFMGLDEGSDRCRAQRGRASSRRRTASVWTWIGTRRRTSTHPGWSQPDAGSEMTWLEIWIDTGTSNE